MSAVKTAGAFVLGFIGAAGAGLAVFILALRAEDRSQEKARDAAKRVEL